MKEVELFFDYASPWAYLATKLLERRMPGVPVVLRPIYLRGFEEFSNGPPMSGRKLAYSGRDLLRCAKHEGVALQMPPTFPVNGVYALRGALVAEKLGVLGRYHTEMFHAAWRDAREVSKKDEVVAITRGLGLNEVADELDAPWVKALLKERTEAAVARGLFGVPTFTVGDEIFWGHDRMDYAARAAAAG